MFEKIPRNEDSGDIMDFLLNSGLPEIHKNDVNINTNGSVYMRGLENDVCQNLIEIFGGLK